jgi:hypothetical protein
MGDPSRGVTSYDLLNVLADSLLFAISLAKRTPYMMASTSRQTAVLGQTQAKNASADASW